MEGENKGIHRPRRGAKAPALVREIYVFGSFARGAMEPNDLDLVVVHDRPSEELMASYRLAVRSYAPNWLDQHFKSHDRFQAAMCRVFRRGAERMDILLGESIENAADGIELPLSELRLLWAEHDRDWEQKLSAITPNASAGRYPRNYFVDIKKAGCTRDEVEKVTAMIGDGGLTLRRLCLDEIEPRLSSDFQRWHDHWTCCRSMGERKLIILPWALWWLKQQRSKCPIIRDRTDVWDERGRFRAALGRFHLCACSGCSRASPTWTDNA